MNPSAVSGGTDNTAPTPSLSGIVQQSPLYAQQPDPPFQNGQQQAQQVQQVQLAQLQQYQQQQQEQQQKDQQAYSATAPQQMLFKANSMGVAVVPASLVSPSFANAAHMSSVLRPPELTPAPPSLTDTSNVIATPADQPEQPQLHHCAPLPHFDAAGAKLPKRKRWLCGCCSCGDNQLAEDIESLTLGLGQRMLSQAVSALKWRAKYYGPWLRFGGYDPTTRMWTGSIVMLVNQSRSPKPPTLYYQDEGRQEREATYMWLKNMALGSKAKAAVTSTLKKLNPRRVDMYREWVFWRFDLELECGPKERKIRYFPHVPTEVALVHRPHHHYTFTLPAANQTWRWGFYSCNGFEDAESEKKAGGIQPMWKDVLHIHKHTPIHVMLGGGDQLYNDQVWETPALLAWTKLPDPVARIHHPFTQDMATQTGQFYFQAYVKQWSQEAFQDALATIPQVMVWDDHDIFDGWGSYPDHLQQCPVFQGVYTIARRFYSVFQLHTSVDRAPQDNHYIGQEGWNLLTCMGPTVAVLMTDSRTERTDKQVMHPESYAMIKSGLEALPATVRHVVVVATVPLIYPKVPGLEAALQKMSTDTPGAFSMAQLMNKTGLASNMMSQFGTIEILDDLMDHWGADCHEKEKLDFVRMLQEVSQSKGVRVSLVSGDVHVGALGRFSSCEETDPRLDHRYMPQIISSAIGNLPPPPAVVTALMKFSAVNKIDKDTQEQMIDLFGPKQCLLGHRNWVIVNEDPDGGELLYEYRVEPVHKHLALHMVTYEVAVPPLDRIVVTAAPASTSEIESASDTASGHV